MVEVPEVKTRTKKKTKLQKPKLFKVVLHNDDYTTMDFVVFILESIFLHSRTDAVRIMLKVHQEGKGIAGVYPYEIAVTKAEKTMSLARSREFPLLCTVEPE
ncbi:MAG: ATP-dependent Clp protease adaptor ClpS [Acidobacteria bacterium]|jgi:ATP-dependent Clp protease adaptor protein ClpS|nr:MAG: ATP-dependent Clp protease adaptor ClpS [Acidobacteriota bacterium]GIU81642.1 MAG: ATP-dependent Clp protease adapter protein ClpS [Pyrinomonadaceae bacterium]